jgi:hypothetical protein
MTFRGFAALTITVGLATVALAETKAVITDGSGLFAEGRLSGYIVQANGKSVCTDPYAIGKYISCASSIAAAGQVWRAPPTSVWADTNGTLGAMVVVDARGAFLCESPTVSVQFRGPNSYILCE